MQSEDNSVIQEEQTGTVVENSDIWNRQEQNGEVITINRETNRHNKIFLAIQQWREKKRVTNLMLAIIIVFVASGLWMVIQQEKSSKIQINSKLILQNDVEVDLPLILWILTERDIKNQRLQQTFYGFHLHRYAQNNGFQTRFVDFQTSYNWLSQPIRDVITNAMHRRKYEVSVGQFLKIALLIEHGGIIIKLGSSILIENLDWIKAIFQQRRFHQNPSILKCQMQSSPELFMFSEQDSYVDYFLASKKSSILLWKIFLEMAYGIQMSKEAFPSFKQIQIMNIDTEAISLHHPFQTLLNYQTKKFEQDTICSSLKLQSIEIQRISDKLKNCSTNLEYVLKGKKEIVMNDCNLKFMIDIRNQSDILTQMFRNAVAGGSSSIGTVQKHSVISQDFFEIEEIRKYIEPLNQTREVYLCIVSLKAIPRQQTQRKIEESMQKLKSYNFTKWKAIYFTQEGSKSVESNEQRTILQTTTYQGLNLQIAVTQHCPLKSIVFLLDFDQYLISRDDLTKISEIFANSSVFGAFISLSLNSTLISPAKINKIKRNQNHPDIQILQTIANHFRVFNRDYYCMISHNDLHNVEGVYYDRTIPFLGMLEMATNMQECSKSIHIFEVKRMKQKIDFPEKMVTLYYPIVTNTYKQINQRQQEYNFKFNYLSFCSNLLLKASNDNWRWIGDEAIIFNRGKVHQSPKQRKQKLKIIPRNIHQIWINGEPSSAKKYMMAQAKRLNPQFEYFLWSKSNITRNNFPYTYEIIQTLFQFDKMSPYNKMSMISDFMRFEIIYQHGGFYMDTNYLWLGKGSLQDWLTYDLVMSGQIYPRMYIYASTSFFGSYKKNPRFLRLLNPECINRVRIYQRSAAIISGPGYIKRIIRGQQQQNDPNTLKPSMEQLFPFYPFDGMTQNNLCRQNNVSNLTDSMMFLDSGYGFKKNCSQLYSMAYGIDFYELGASWTKRRW